jgi:hypothetical protein
VQQAEFHHQLNTGGFDKNGILAFFLTGKNRHKQSVPTFRQR